MELSWIGVALLFGLLAKKIGQAVCGSIQLRSI